MRTVLLSLLLAISTVLAAPLTGQESRPDTRPTSRPESSTTPRVVDLSAGLDSFRAAFNGSHDKPKLVAILSPT